MPKPITPYCGCDSFVIDNQHRLLLIRRTDNGFWALPGGCQNLGETPAECAVRECQEESGYLVRIDTYCGQSLRLFINLRRSSAPQLSFVMPRGAW